MADLQYLAAVLRQLNQPCSFLERFSDGLLDQDVGSVFDEVAGDSKMARRRRGYADGIDAAKQASVIGDRLDTEALGDRSQPLGIAIHYCDEPRASKAGIFGRMMLAELADPDYGRLEWSRHALSVPIPLTERSGSRLTKPYTMRKSASQLRDLVMSQPHGHQLLHTMIRVLDLDKSIDFYTRHLGMKLLRRKDYPSGEFTLAFVGYGDEDRNSVIELTHNWGQKEAYSLGTGFGHLAVSVPDIYGTCERLAREGVKIPRPPGPMKHGGSVIAFIEDPDGYKIELVERKPNS